MFAIKMNKIINERVLWKTCFSPLHRKCCKVKLGDIAILHDVEKIVGMGECLLHAQAQKIPLQ